MGTGRGTAPAVLAGALVVALGSPRPDPCMRIVYVSVFGFYIGLECGFCMRVLSARHVALYRGVLWVRHAAFQHAFWCGVRVLCGVAVCALVGSNVVPLWVADPSPPCCAFWS